MKKILIILALILGQNAKAQSTEVYASGNAGGALIIGYSVPYFTLGLGVESKISDNYFVDAQVNAPYVFLVQPSLGFGKYVGQDAKISTGFRTFPQAWSDGELAIGGYVQYEYNNWNVNVEAFGLYWINASVGYRFYF